MTDKLGRFGHHPNPASDYCMEVDAIVKLYTFYEAKDLDRVKRFQARLTAALSFRVGGVESAVVARALLVEVADRAFPGNVGTDYTDYAGAEIRMALQNLRDPTTKDLYTAEAERTGETRAQVKMRLFYELYNTPVPVWPAVPYTDEELRTYEK